MGVSNHSSDSSLTLIREAGDQPERARRRFFSRYIDVTINASILIIPMLLLTGALLAIIYFYRLRHDSTNQPYPDVWPSSEKDESGVLYVDVASTRLIFIASWSSSLAPMLVASIVTLWSYSVAQRLAKASVLGETKNLPSPYQFGLTLTLMNVGGFTSLFKWTSYLIGRRRNRQPQGDILISIGSAVAIGTVLSSLVFIADTWLHLVTKPVEFIEAKPLTSEFDYSFGLTDDCTKGNNSVAWQLSPKSPWTYNSCSMRQDRSDPGTYFMMESTVALKVLNNRSATITASEYDSDTPYAFLGIPSSSPATVNVDYVASTFGLQTKCSPITHQCNFNSNESNSVPFNCSEVFYGNIKPHVWEMMYFTDSTMENNVTTSGVENPFFFGWAAILSTENDVSNMDFDSDLISLTGVGFAIALLCETTAYDIVYTSTNGTITSFDPKISNISVSNVAQVNMANFNLADGYLQQNADVTAITASTAQMTADQMALPYSKAAISLFSTTIDPRPAVQAQIRASRIVSRVPIAPLFMLVAANMLFVLAGLILLFTTITLSDKRDISEVQTRLGIFGLVADRFEQPHAWKKAEKPAELFTEHQGEINMRIGLEQSDEGGWKYRTWRV